MKEPLCKKETATIRINSEPPKPTTFEDLGYVQVVRCKDCEHAQVQNGDLVWCEHVDDGLAHFQDWFCADGKEKRKS